MSISPKGKKQKHTSLHFDLADITPLTENQIIAFNSDKNLVLKGSAGTGKSFISCYLALEDIFINRLYKKLIIIRSAVPTRDMGFLPGDDKEKAKIYEQPYQEICKELLQRGDAYDIMKSKNIVEFITTSFLRGLTFRRSVIIVDECQNMSMHELDTLITRVGKECRIIFCGDTKQGDLKNSGFSDFCRILDEMEEDFETIEFNVDDIVRSDFVKKYLITKENLNI